MSKRQQNQLNNWNSYYLPQSQQSTSQSVYQSPAQPSTHHNPYENCM